MQLWRAGIRHSASAYANACLATSAQDVRVGGQIRQRRRPKEVVAAANSNGKAGCLLHEFAVGMAGRRIMTHDDSCVVSGGRGPAPRAPASSGALLHAAIAQAARFHSHGPAATKSDSTGLDSAKGTGSRKTGPGGVGAAGVSADGPLDMHTLMSLARNYRFARWPLPPSALPDGRWRLC